jgi:hypothetical protein
MQPTNAVIEATGEFSECVRRNPEQSLDLLLRQFGPDTKARFSWITKERFAEPWISYQSPQGPFNTALAHGFVLVLVPWSPRDGTFRSYVTHLSLQAIRQVVNRV